ncbi:hypothetical protein DPMN_033311 [Dreissena polymorpha]|uniref:Uncharacterized protein n=1 Tax=Dreissena polymorpha TaxID=45954 RepID=A0A9D4M6D9_DREPO|nr:hypothetical protein DPMN_033311 [Dreissena polymorpha]
MGHFSKLDRDAKKKEKEEGSAAPTSPACAQLATDSSIKELSVVLNLFSFHQDMYQPMVIISPRNLLFLIKAGHHHNLQSGNKIL